MVRSFVSCASSCGLFCRFRPRPKKEAMLSGKGALRRSWGKTGDDVRGCVLFAGPGRSYLDGASMRFIEGKGCSRRVRISSTGLSVVFVACCAIAMMRANHGW